MENANKIANIISIDPSISNCGIAIGNKKDGVVNAWVVGSNDSKLFYRKRLSILLGEIMSLVCKEYCYEVILELPDTWGKDRNKKAMMQLWRTIGNIERELMSNDINVHTVTVREWKGNVPKTKTLEKVKHKHSDLVMELIERIPKSKINNAYDAIGILDYYLGTI